MNKVFLIGDTHFGHAKILDFERDMRPFTSVEEMNETLVENWNSVVKKHDTVWHLGDVAFGQKNIDICSRLNGHKHLVLGNHDQYPLELYQKYFNKIVASYKLAGYLLTHVPIHPSQFYRFKGNIHGHLHSSTIKKEIEYETGIGMLHDWVPDENYFNVSAEQINLTPIELNELLNS